MDFILIYRLMDCMRRGLAPDMDVYDGAAWSAPGLAKQSFGRTRKRSGSVSRFHSGPLAGRKGSAIAEIEG